VFTLAYTYNHNIATLSLLNGVGGPPQLIKPDIQRLFDEVESLTLVEQFWEVKLA
jgi:hypothetical protein